MKGGPSIKHLDDVPMEEMVRFEFSDGERRRSGRSGSRCRRATSPSGIAGIRVR